MSTIKKTFHVAVPAVWVIRTMLLRFSLPFMLAWYLTLQVPDAAAQTEGVKIEATVNVPYIVQFGFGSYEVGGLSTSTYRIPLAHTLLLGDTQEDLRLKLTGYLGYSHAYFETYLLGPKLSAKVDYLFLLPQAELLIPLSHGWTLKPYLAAGGGYSFNGSIELEGYRREPLSDGGDILYAGGLSVLFEQSLQGFDLSFGSRLGWAGETPVGEGKDQGFGTFQNGLEVKHPIGVSLAGKPFDLAGSFIYYYFFPAAEFSMAGRPPLKVSNQFEFGTTLGLAKPSKLWIFDNPRIGVSYRFGDGMTGFRLNLGFPF